jgi:hypothetical protein
MASRTMHLLLGACAIAAAAGCKGTGAEPTLSKGAPQVDEGIPDVPVPPADGPKLYATRPGVQVLERPAKGARAIGELRMGAPVARAAKAHSTRGCDGGWYPVRPRGFVCVGDGASLASGPVVPPPRLDRPLPYRYAEATGATPLYERLPSVEEQVASEPAIEKHFAKRMKAKPERIGTGANDVPLDGRGVAIGLPVLAKSGEGVDADGNRVDATYFADVPSLLPPPTRAEQLLAPVVAGVLRKGSSLAVADVVTSEGPAGARSFAVLPTGQMVPLDRLEPSIGSAWHGVSLNDGDGESRTELPVAFTLRHGVTLWSLDRLDAERLDDEEMPRRTAVDLTGRFRTVDGVRFDETKSGYWVRAKDIAKIVQRSKFPDFVTAGTRWIDVSLALQTLTLYEGKKAVYATLISSGADVLGDPETSSATPRGNFTIDRASLTAKLDGKEVQDAFEVLDAPWVLAFAKTAAGETAEMFGATFADRIGEARYHKDIAMTPIDARRVFAWVVGEPPAGWQSWEIPEDQRVTVHVRP